MSTARADEHDQDLDEDHPSTRIANGISEALAVVVPLSSASEWAHFCATVPADERKPSILRELSALARMGPLIELPTVHGPKPWVRDLVAIAAELEPLVAAWDDAAPPTPAMADAAGRFLARMRDPEADRDAP